MFASTLSAPAVNGTQRFAGRMPKPLTRSSTRMPVVPPDCLVRSFRSPPKANAASTPAVRRPWLRDRCLITKVAGVSNARKISSVCPTLSRFVRAPQHRGRAGVRFQVPRLPAGAHSGVGPLINDYMSALAAVAVLTIDQQVADDDSAADAGP